MDQYEQAIAIFDKYAEQYQDKFMAYEPYVETYDAFLNLLGPQHINILDVASGPGNIAKHFLSKSPNLKIYGIDLSAKMIQLARTNCPSATFEVKDSRDIGNMDKKFDVIIAGFCFPYLSKDDVKIFLEHSKKLLNPGGLLYISTMEGPDERSGINQKNSQDKVYTHYHQFEYIERHLELNNFKVTNIMRKDFPVDNEAPTTDLFIFAKVI